jgi:hypothetical protein
MSRTRICELPGGSQQASRIRWRAWLGRLIGKDLEALIVDGLPSLRYKGLQSRERFAHRLFEHRAAVPLWRIGFLHGANPPATACTGRLRLQGWFRYGAAAQVQPAFELQAELRLEHSRLAGAGSVKGSCDKRRSAGTANLEDRRRLARTSHRDRHGLITRCLFPDLHSVRYLSALCDSIAAR